MPSRPRPAPPWRLVLVVLAVVGAAFLLPRVAAAHTRLEGSAPAAGDTVRGAVSEVRLRFSRTAQTAFTGIELEGPGGVVATGKPREVGDEGREFVFDLAAPLAPGAYVVRWRTAGRDGHPLRGSFTFLVAAPDGTLPAPPGADPATGAAAAPADSGHAAHAMHAADTASVVAVSDADAADDFGGEATTPEAAPLAVALRWLAFLGLLGVVGAVAFGTLVLRPGGDTVPAEVLARAAAGARRLGAGAALLFLATLPVRLWSQLAALAAPGEAPSAAQASALLAAPWGWGWVLGVTGALLVAVALLRGRGAPSPLAVVGAVAAAFSPALMGHAAAVEGVPALAVAADGVHVLAAAAWMGGLAALVLAGIPAALGASGADGGDGALAATAGLVARFSPVALAAAAVAGATGVVSALFHLGAPSQLWTTAYGLTLLAKLALLGGVAALGFFNWRRVTPALGTEAGTRTLRRSAGAELVVGILVVLATAVLVAQPTP